jgi:hypothetical protein
MAGCTALLAVPGAILACTRPGTSPKSWLTPASTTCTARPWSRASTLTAAPPARKFMTICQVTSCG